MKPRILIVYTEVSLAKCGKGVGIMLIEHYDGENECHKIIR